MKRKLHIILTTLAVGVLLSSCVWGGPEDGEENLAISFSESITRALKTSFEVGDSFAVWGAMVDGAESVEIFDGTEVTQVAAGDWTYSPERYWFDGWSYDFIALHPALSGVTYDIPAQTIAISNFPTTQGTDLLMAKRTGINYDPVNPTVALTFGHMLSKLEFAGSNEDNGLTIEITNIRLEGKSYGQFDGTTWTQSGASGILAQNTLATPVELPQSPTHTTLLSNVLVVPGAIDNAMQLIISYKVDGIAKPNRTIALTEASLTSLQAGKSYRYTFILDPSGNIIFGKPEVDDWGSIYGGTFIIDPDPDSDE